MTQEKLTKKSQTRYYCTFYNINAYINIPHNLIQENIEANKEMYPEIEQIAIKDYSGNICLCTQDLPQIIFVDKNNVIYKQLVYLQQLNFKINIIKR